MEYNFVKFEDKNGRFESRITVTGSYSIGFPTKFYKDNNIEAYKYAILFWDKDNKAIGIQLSNDENEVGRIKIAKTKDYGGTVSVRSFFMKNDINPKEYKGRYDWEKVQQQTIGEMYVIKLILTDTVN
jgi:hypothetical protein